MLASPSGPSPPTIPGAATVKGSPPLGTNVPPTVGSAPPPPRGGEILDLSSEVRDRIRAVFWRVDASAKVIGDVDVVEGDVVGVASIGGKLTAVQFRSDGLLDVEGEVNVSDLLRVFGSFRTSGPVNAGDLIAEGSILAGAQVTLRRTGQWSGFLEGTKGLSADVVRFNGGLRLTGDLEAREVWGALGAPSRVAAIRAERVVVRQRRWRLGSRGMLSVDRIEGQSVELEGVECEYVRAPRVVVGRGCHLSRVDGRILRRHRSAYVGPESRTPPPHGLTR